MSRIFTSRREFCQAVCHAASTSGFRLSLERQSAAVTEATWLIEGHELRIDVPSSRESALTEACKKLVAVKGWPFGVVGWAA